MRSVLGVGDLDEDQAPPQNAGATHWVFQTFSILTGILLLVSSVFGKDLWWRAIVLGFAGIFIVWGGWILWPSAITRWEERRARVKHAVAARRLYPEFLDILKQFRRYTDTTNRADSVPFVLWGLSQRNELSLHLPLDIGGAHYPGRFYEHLRLRVRETPPRLAKFCELLETFSDILELYHRVYVCWPYEELRRSPTVAQIPMYVRADLDVQRDEYNAFLMDVNAFGRRINEVLGDESFFPSHLEILKPLS
jgi:hypothetical protein